MWRDLLVANHTCLVLSFFIDLLGDIWLLESEKKKLKN